MSAPDQPTDMRQNLPHEGQKPQPGEKTNPKAAELLLKYFEQSVKKVDTSINLAWLMAAFLLVPGLEGAFSLSRRSEATVVIPYFNLKAELLTAALFGLALYWFFCIRAASQTAQARKIAMRLQRADLDLLDAALHIPSLVTGSVRSKRATCIFLALAGVLAWILIYLSPLGLQEAAWGSVSMAVPPWILWAALSRSPVPRSENP